MTHWHSDSLMFAGLWKSVMYGSRKRSFPCSCSPLILMETVVLSFIVWYMIHVHGVVAWAPFFFVLVAGPACMIAGHVNIHVTTCESLSVIIMPDFNMAAQWEMLSYIYSFITAFDPNSWCSAAIFLCFGLMCCCSSIKECLSCNFKN